MSDDSDDSIIESAVGELDTAQNQTTTENYRASLTGWRELAGTTVGFAVFVDLMFIMAGGWLITNTTGGLVYIGVLAAGTGLFGLLEKTHRRLQ